ncbi:MAG: nucleoside triphosphate pyrophosphohydrolase [Clostridia bacterium]|nr:nucleoside triphosphate pyrophosphohydrolase [Clostridia bacterium]
MDKFNFDSLFATLQLSHGKGLIIAEAQGFEAAGADPGLGLLLLGVSNRELAASVSSALKGLYPETHPLTVVWRAGLPGEQRTETVTLAELEGLPGLDDYTCIYLKPNPEGRQRTIAGLTAIMARLRGQGGCPWDREQTHQSLRRYLVEETYEVLEAIDAADMNKLCEELGDLLLQVVFHAHIASEEGHFSLADCIEAICIKMIRRHPHVFGTATLDTAGEVLQRWEQIKAAEKRASGIKNPSILSVPPDLPALLKALKVQEQAARVGFDWPELSGVQAKIGEELEELEKAILNGQRQQQIEEIGDLLFSLVNLARWLEIEPEAALQGAVNKFCRRFNYLEEQARQKGEELERLGLKKLDKLWEKAKKIQ